MSKRDRDGLKVSDGSLVVEEACADEICDEIRRGLKSLFPRQAQILQLRYGIGDREHTLQEIAEKLGLTRERVRQIQVNAEQKLQPVIGLNGALDQQTIDHIETVETPTEEIAQ